LQQLPDEKSYNPIEFGTLDTAFSRVEEDPTYIGYNEKLVAEYDEWADHVYGSILNRSQSEKFYALLDTMEQLRKNHQPRPIGWKMRHSFKANIGKGTYKKMEIDVVMNWSVDSVYYDIDKND
jgi:hypothetical protein